LDDKEPYTSLEMELKR